MALHYDSISIEGRWVLALVAATGGAGGRRAIQIAQGAERFACIVRALRIDSESGAIAIRMARMTFGKSRAGALLEFALLFTFTALAAEAGQQPQQQPQSQGSSVPPASRPTGSTKGASTLPAQCLAHRKASEQFGELLDAIHEHPTAGAYNTLGALFAQKGFDVCAIASFEAALRLDDKSWDAHYNLALALIKKGDKKRAADELHAVIADKPDSAVVHHALGELLEGGGKLNEAAAEYAAVLRIDPHFPSGAVDLAQALAAQQKLDDAIGVLQQALSLSPSREESESLGIALGLAFAQDGDHAKAIDTLRHVVSDHPDSANAHFALGSVYAGQGQGEGQSHDFDSEAAVAEFRAAIRLAPKADPARLALGRILLAQTKYSEALGVLHEYTLRQPHDATGFRLIGLTYEGFDQWDSALEALAQAAQLKPGDYAVRRDFGLALLHNDQIDEAIREFVAAEKIDPNQAEVHQQLAALYEKKGEGDLARAEKSKSARLAGGAVEKDKAAQLNDQANKMLSVGDARGAAEAYRQALRLVPNDAEMHYNLSLALERLGDVAGEQRELERAVQLDSKMSVAHNQLGLLALGSARPVDAEREFNAALETNPKFAEAMNNLGVLYTQQGKDSEAVTLFQKATSYDPRYTRAYVNLGLTLARHGQFTEAAKKFNMALLIDPKDVGAYTALGMVDAKLGRPDESITDFRKAVELAPSSADAHLNLGIALADHFDRAGSFQEFSEAARLDPDSLAAHFNLGRFYYEASKYEDARRELEVVLKKNPDFANALYFLALTERQANHVGRSEELLQKVVALDPHQADAQYLLGQDLEKLGKESEAIEHWKLALQADPNHSQALYNLARALNKRHDPQAQEYQDRFDALQKQQQISDRVSQLGNFAMEAANAQNWPQAIEQTREAIEQCGSCPDAAHLHRNLGLFYCRTGKIDEGEAELRKALEIDPTEADAQKAIAALANVRGADSK